MRWASRSPRHGNIDPHSPCADASSRGLARISGTLRETDYVMMSNLETLDLAKKRRTGGGLMPVIEMHLRAVGCGPSLDYESAAAFLAQFQPLVDMARRRMIN
jgi:hypothetical protein